MPRQEANRISATRPIPPLLPLQAPPLRGRYRLDAQIGQGQTSIIFHATDLVTAKPCAIKMLRAASLGQPELRQRFEHEVRIMGQYPHPGAVAAQVFDIDEEGRPFVVMELLRGEDAGSSLRRQLRLPLQRVRHIVKQAAETLSQLHQLGIVHGGLAPANLFLCRDAGQSDEEMPSVKLLDFGAARSADACNTAVDQRGLAAAAFFMLSGQPAFATESSATELPGLVTHRAPLHVLCPDVPEAVSKVVQRALSRNRRARFRSITAFAYAFESACLTPSAKTTAISISTEKVEQMDPQQGKTVQMEPALLEDLLKTSGVLPAVPAPVAPATRGPTSARDDMLVIRRPVALMIVGVPLGLLLGALLGFVLIRLI